MVGSSPLASVVSPEPVLTPEVLRLARAVADRYAGTLADVLRLAVPPRHAAVEREAAVDPGRPEQLVVPRVDDEPWARYRRGPAFLRPWPRVGARERPGRPCPGPPSDDRPLHWIGAVVAAVVTTAAAGRGVLVVVPDHRDVEQVGRSRSLQRRSRTSC